MIDLKTATEATARLSALKYFPSGNAARAEIGELLYRMVQDSQSLDWLIAAMIDRVGEWPGTRELRAIYCTRFKPADGIEAWSQLGGFSASDSEAALSVQGAVQKHAELTAPRAGGGLKRISASSAPK